MKFYQKIKIKYLYKTLTYREVENTAKKSEETTTKAKIVQLNFF